MDYLLSTDTLGNPAPPPVFDLKRALFPKQLPFGEDKSRWATSVCTRRAGKTFGCAAKLLDVAIAKPGCACLYITLSRINAKRIIWGTLKLLNEEHKLGGIALEGELCIAFPNGSRVYLSGCADSSEVDKFLGLPIGIVIIDEAQAFPDFLQRLVDEVLSNALVDYDGQLVLIGTPGPVPIGYFHDCAIKPDWSHHAWTVFDNPYIQQKSGKAPQQLLEEELQRRGVTIDDPVIQRNWFAKWVLDVNSLVFRFDPKANARSAPSHQHHVIGVDLGFDDADAIAVLGWSDDAPEVDLVYEWVGAKQTITTLMGQVRNVYDKYKPLAVVADTGGLGKKIAEEIQARTGIPIEAADKARKLEHIELLNDALRTHRFFAPKDSRMAQDALLVEWDRSDPEKPKISERFHSDILDAVLYGYMRCLEWLYVEPKKAAPKVNSAEWFEQQIAAQQAEIDKQFDEQLKANKQNEREEREADQFL